MRALVVLACIALCAAVVAGADVDAEVDAAADKPRKAKRLQPPTMLKPKHFMPRVRVVIVPKGDPRARPPVATPPAAAIPAVPVLPSSPVAVPPIAPTAAMGANAAARDAVVPQVIPFPAQPQPQTPIPQPLVSRVLKAGTPTSSACAAKKGVCKASSSCSGSIVRGICPGNSSVICCVPKGAAPTKPATKPTTKPSTPASSSSCPVYANAPISSIKGNNNVMYQVVRIAAQHFSGSADNTMTKATACAFARMAEAAAKAGIRLTINSGFRTLARQQYFWNCYQTKRCNNGNLAARPGNSNHGRGQALDINTGATSTKTYKWMAANAARFGFRRTVPSEPWHWEH